MKKLTALALLAMAAPAFAAIMGVLTRSEPTTSVTGKLVYKCTYNVAGSYTTVILEQMCPPTMNFN